MLSGEEENHPQLTYRKELEMDNNFSIFYLDHLSRISWSVFITIIVSMVVFLDLFTQFLGWTYETISITLYTAYSSRLASIVFVFYTLRTSYYDLCNLINEMSDRLNATEIRILRDNLNFLNNPVHHLFSGAVANILYILILKLYIFPVLHWRPFHIFSNSLWVGMLGIGVYVALFGCIFTFRSLRMISGYKLIDPFSSDGMGGLAPISKITIKIIVLVSIAIGLWIGSLIYSIEEYVLFLIMVTGVMIGLSVLGFITYKLHRGLTDVKNMLMKEHINKIKIIGSQDLGSSNKFELAINLLKEQIILLQLDRVKTWPINIDSLINLMGILLGFIPLIIQYIIG